MRHSVECLIALKKGRKTKCQELLYVLYIPTAVLNDIRDFHKPTSTLRHVASLMRALKTHLFEMTLTDINVHWTGPTNLGQTIGSVDHT